MTKTNRRDFIKKAGAAGALALALPHIALKRAMAAAPRPTTTGPVVISTWNHGFDANAGAWKILSKGGYALDAVEAGVMITENDPNGHTVGLGGYPDREGHVTLDACIMDEQSRCGAVAFLEHIKNPIAVARRVMEKTPHVMLAGDGALQFALEQGFKKENILTPEAEQAWRNWLKQSKYQPVINIENHDTIALLALDKQGNLSGACTTSGAAFKMHGRVGDSPIIGAGLFVDNEVGAAAATGLGEAVIRTAGSAMVVELMRQGYTPQQACQEAVQRIARKKMGYKNLQVGFIALSRDGSYGAYSIEKDFTYALCHNQQENKVFNAKYYR